METEGDLEGAIAVFNEIIKKYSDDRIVAAQAQLYIGLCYERMGRAEAKKAYHMVIDNYPGSGDVVNAARQRLKVLIPRPPVKSNLTVGIGQEFSKIKLKENESGIPLRCRIPGWEVLFLCGLGNGGSGDFRQGQWGKKENNG